MGNENLVHGLSRFFVCLMQRPGLNIDPVADFVIDARYARYSDTDMKIAHGYSWRILLPARFLRVSNRFLCFPTVLVVIFDRLIRYTKYHIPETPLQYVLFCTTIQLYPLCSVSRRAPNSQIFHIFLEARGLTKFAGNPSSLNLRQSNALVFRRQAPTNCQQTAAASQFYIT